MQMNTARKVGQQMEPQKKGSRIVAEMERQIVAGAKDVADTQQIGCHNDGSGGTHNDN